MSRGFVGIGVWHPKSESNVGTLWRSAYTYEAAFIFTVGRRYRKQASDTVDAARHTPLFHFLTLEGLQSQLPYGALLIGVEQAPGARNLEGFGHPERAVYLLGAEDHGLPRHVLDACHSIVQIPTPRRACLNVAVAGSIVLHDRHLKGAATRWKSPSLPQGAHP